MSDIHNNWDMIDPAVKLDVDLCLIAGDLTNLGMRSRGREVLAAMGWMDRFVATTECPILWIPGNHDIGITGAIFEGLPCCACIDGKVISCQGLRIAGVSLTTCYDYPDWAYQWDYMTFIEAKEKRYLYDALKEHGPLDILVSHGPPFNTLDQTVDGRHPGSAWLLRYIEECRPGMVICGHIHEAAGHAAIGETRIINVAQRWELVEVPSPTRGEGLD